MGGVTIQHQERVTEMTESTAVIRRYLAEQHTALLAGDDSLRRGTGGIHPTRVATRRIRSTLRVFAQYFDPAAAAEFDVELAWYATILGEVRDREVQRQRIKLLIGELPDELVLGPVAARIEQQLLAEQIAAEQQLAQAMKGKRYAALLKAAGSWAAATPFADSAGKQPAALSKQVRKARRKLIRHLAAGLGPTGTDEELHKARKAGKRARYATELATPVLGADKAARLTKRFQEIQDILGDHQDGVVAAALLRRLGAATAGQPGENGFTYGILYAQELHRAERSRKLAAARYREL